MSGIFEQQVARIDALENAVRQLLANAGAGAAAAPANTGLGGLGGAAAPANTGLGGLGGAPVQQQQQVQVTDTMIMDLVRELVANEQSKQACLAQMQQMGLQELAQAQPSQYAELYQRFMNVKQQFSGGAGVAQGAATGGAPSII